MIRILDEGEYALIETRRHTRILRLGSLVFAWITSTRVGEILVSSHRAHKTDHILALGKYRIYDVTDENFFTDLLHLELSVGNGKWQGYLLPTGLPTNKHTKSRIIPTTELITSVYTI